MTGVRLLLADRSATVRSVLKRAFGEFETITVIGESADGRDVVDLVRKTAPDGLVMDLDLIGLGGRELIESVAAVQNVPIFTLIPATRSDNTRIAFAAHHLGVVGVHPKPDQPAGWADLGRILGQSILEVCSKTGAGVAGLTTADDVTVVRRGLRYVGIGASTGGPGALCELLRALGANATFGIAVVQHIADGFEAALVEWLASESGLDVAVARDGESLSAGIVRFAPAGGHMIVSGDGRLFLDRRSPAENGHTPSVDVLFRSLLEHPAETVAAIQLSGMGSDGARAMAALRRSNVLTMAQDEASCAVFGMPRTAIEMGGVTFTLAPAQIGRLLAHASGTQR
jgi:two-component system, chemotaxis family, protein-glutamate methylesterase/glutaminase